MDKVFGRRLKELREEKDMKQSDLAKILECSSSAIGMYEQGRRYVDLDGLKKIAEYFDVSADYLIGRTDIKKFEDFPPIENILPWYTFSKTLNIIYCD